MISVTLLALTSLLSALILMSIVLSIIMRTHRSPVQMHFAYFNTNLAICLVSGFLLSVNNATLQIWGGRFFMLSSLVLPLTGLRFFASFLVGLEKFLSRMLRISIPISIILAGFVVTPLSDHIVAFLSSFGYVCLSFCVCFILMFWRLRHSHSVGERARLRSVVYGGVLSLLLVLLDVISFRFDWAYIFLGGLFLSIYMYYLLQIVLTARAPDTSELIGRGIVLGILSFLISGLYWLITFWADSAKLGTFFATVMVASIIILILYEPLKQEVEGRAADYFFRQRRELRLLLEELRRELVRVIDLDKSARILLDRLKRSKRVTHASFYLFREDETGYDKIHSFGLGSPPLVEVSLERHASFLQHLKEVLSPVVKQEVEFRYASTLFDGKRESAGIYEEERLIDILRTLDDLHAEVCFPCVSSGGELLGFINLKEERFEEAYSTDELSFMMMVAAQLAITIENSRLFEKMKERERLVALGEMSAGLAHEIRNPLGAIKGAAQLINPEAYNEGEQEFIAIILEEVDRLNSVVCQFLDYARPLREGFTLTDVNKILQRTLQLMEVEECFMDRVRLDQTLEEDIPLIYADPEQLKQVFINIIHNACEAMEEEGGTIFIETELVGDLDHPMIEISFIDEGEGIPNDVLKNIFIPFYTTKEKGTGLGLSICQRIIEHHGGWIQIQSNMGEGSYISIRLPVKRPEEK